MSIDQAPAVGRNDGIRLSVTSYVVLGMIALRGPSTPYDLKRAVGRSVGYFWQFPHAQLYAEPKRLAAAGLLTLTQEHESRRRKTYSLTPAGSARLQEWLKAPVDEPLQIRNIAEIKLFLGELTDARTLHTLARDQAAMHRRRIAEFDAIRDRFADEPDRKPRILPLELGLRLERAALEFWEEHLDDQPSASS